MIPVLLILSALILCGFIWVIATLYMRPSEISLDDKSIDLSEVLPIQHISDDVIVNGNGDITVGYHLLLPEVFTLSEKDALYMHERLEALLKRLPAGTVIHQQNCYYTDEYKNVDYSTNALISENIKFLDGKEVINCYTNLYITFTNTIPETIRKKASNTSLLWKLNYPFKKPFKHLKERLSEMESVLYNFEDGITSISQFRIKRMISVDLNNAIYNYVNLTYNKPVEDARECSSNPISTKYGCVMIGDQRVAVLSLTEEGATLYELKEPNTSQMKALGSKLELPNKIKSKSSMIYPLGFGLPFNHIVNVVIEITDTDKTIDKIKTERTGLNALAVFYDKAKEKQYQQKEFYEAVSKFDHQTSYTAVNVIISDTDQDRLTRKVALVHQAYSLMNQSSCFVENAELCNIFFCTIPGNARANYRGFINTIEQSICYLQKDSLYISDIKGHIFTDRFGSPTKIDMWGYKTLNNKNRILIGPSGSGKSFFLNNYILQAFELERDVIIIDIGGSYKSMISLNNGVYYDSTDESKFSFNPFLCDRDKNGNYMYIDNSDVDSAQDLINTIVAILSFIWKGNGELNMVEVSILRRSIRSFYEYVNNSSQEGTKERIFPCLNTYKTYMEDVFPLQMKPFEKKKFEVEELVLLLERYTTGELSFLLNATDNVDIVHDRLIAFDMEDASKKDYFPIVVIIALQMVIDKIKRRQGVDKELIIDEALDFLCDPKFGPFIAYLYRTFRKKSGSITLAAQNVLFLKGMQPEIKDSILINCDTKIILDHSNYRMNYPDLQNVLSISEDEIAMIDSLQTKEDAWREFFLKLGNDKFVFRNEVSPFAGVAFDSRQATVVRIKALFEETGSTYAAISRYLEERRKKYG